MLLQYFIVDSDLLFMGKKGQVMLKQVTNSDFNFWKDFYLRQIEEAEKEISGVVKKSPEEIEFDKFIHNGLDAKARLTDYRNKLEQLGEDKRKWDGITEWLIE